MLVNASMLNRKYQPVHDGILINLSKEGANA